MRNIFILLAWYPLSEEKRGRTSSDARSTTKTTKAASYFRMARPYTAIMTMGKRTSSVLADFRFVMIYTVAVQTYARQSGTGSVVSATRSPDFGAVDIWCRGPAVAAV